MGQQIEQWVGVDIGGSFHEACILDSEGNVTRRERVNKNPEDHRRFVKTLKRSRCRVTMEATGIYFLDLAMDLTNAGIEVDVVNPRQIHHFAKVMNKRSSTDTISAQLIAEYGKRMDFRSWTPPKRDWYELRSLARQINRLTGQRTKASNRLHALQAAANGSLFVIRDEKQSIKELGRRIDRLQKQALKLIARDRDLRRMLANITTACGFAERSAIAIMGELLLLPRTLNAKQCSAHAGLDVRFKKSGTSVEFKPKLSKVGNAYLRSALYLPVLTAVKHDPIAKAHYLQLQSRGKPKIKAIGAMMRKYLTGIWSVIRQDEPFDTSKLFACSPAAK